VVSKRLKCMQQVVEAERQHGEWAIRLVGLLLAHRRPPEVVQENVDQRSVRPQILVVPDCADVIENKPALSTVVIADYAGYAYTQELEQVALRRACGSFPLPFPRQSGGCILMDSGVGVR